MAEQMGTDYMHEEGLQGVELAAYQNSKEEVVVLTTASAVAAAGRLQSEHMGWSVEPFPRMDWLVALMWRRYFPLAMQQVVLAVLKDAVEFD